jgi:hypothetical protein
VNLVYAEKISVKNDGGLKIGMPAEMWITPWAKKIQLNFLNWAIKDKILKCFITNFKQDHCYNRQSILWQKNPNRVL